MIDKFLKKTREALILDDESEKRLSLSGFACDSSDSLSEDCVLIMGLNPAGDEHDAIRDSLQIEFFNCIDDDIRIQSEFIYPNYFRPILRFVDDVTNKNAKWSWCNKKWDYVYDEIQKDKGLLDAVEHLQKFYQERSTKKYTIYIGDMFYYHETNSKKLPIKQNLDCHAYYNEMLKMHLDELKIHNKNVRFVYVNNAQVSHWLDQQNTTFEWIDGIPVFYGSMLSGQRAMDTYSRSRLINEIKKVVPDL